MEKIVMKRKGQKHKRLENMLREQHFDNRWKIGEKARSYQSLSDPHASYYFNSSPVRKRLVSWKKTVKVEERNPRLKQKMTQLIDHRLAKTQADELLIKTKTYLSELKPLEFNKLARESIFSLSTLYSKRKTKNYFLTKKSDRNKKRQLFFEENHEHNFQPFQKKEEKIQRIQTEYYQNPELPQQFRVPILIPKKKTKESLKAQQLREQLHQKKRIKWLSFLEEKKKNIQQTSLTVEEL